MSCSARASVIPLLIAGVCVAQVQNAADANTGSFADTAVAPGSLAFVADFASGPISINGSAVSIRTAGSSTAVAAQVLSVSNTGITFLVPPDTPLGTAQLIYKQSGELTQWAGISIVPAYFALYRTALNVNADGSSTTNGLASPAQPGQAIEIFGTGLAAIPQSPPQVTLGGVPQTILYAGNAPGQPGLIQINLQISAGAPDGCYVPLNITWGTNTVTSSLSKTSDGMPCHHPFQLSIDALKALDRGNTIETGLISITTALNAASSARASRQESANVTFLYLAAPQIASYFTARPMQGCTTGTVSGLAGISLGSGSQLGKTMTLQSSVTTLTLPSTGPLEYQTVIPPSADAPLNNLPAPVIGAGKWTWSSSGGSDLPASSFSFNLAAPVRLDGGSPLSIQSGHDQTITWDGSSFDSGATLQLSLTTQGFGPSLLVCYAPAQTGTLNIPQSMLMPFSAGTVGSLSVSVSEWGPEIPHADFKLSGGAPLLMLVLQGTTDTRPVDFK
jgi:uncharacterized protein (TIGR03437 family)